MEFVSFITENCLYLVVALYIVGIIIKKIPKIPDWTIPFILLFLGELACIAQLGLNVEAVAQGVFVTGTAVFGNQAIKQLINRNASADVAGDVTEEHENEGE